MYKCVFCKVKKSKEGYGTNEKSGRRNRVCLDCSPFYSRKPKDHPDKVKHRQSVARKWREANPDRIKATTTSYRKRNRDKINKTHKKWRDKNKDKRRIMSANQQAAKKQRTVGWLNEAQKEWIKWFYKQAVKMEELHGIKYHVDHIHPLRGKNFCGLHVPWNLQVLKASENVRKSNKLME